MSSLLTLNAVRCKVLLCCEILLASILTAIVDGDLVLSRELAVNENEARADVVFGFLVKKWTGNCERCELRRATARSAGASGGGNIHLSFTGRGMRKVLGKRLELISKNPLLCRRILESQIGRHAARGLPREANFRNDSTTIRNFFRLMGKGGEIVTDPAEMGRGDFQVEVGSECDDPPGDKVRVMTGLFEGDEWKDEEFIHTGSRNLEVVDSVATIQTVRQELETTGLVTLYKGINVKSLHYVTQFSTSNALPRGL